MPFRFQKTKKPKSQWHFDGKDEPHGYEVNDEEIHTDVLGSYTGTPYDGIRPVQDADDL
ncbi:MAG: hypothetical protein ACI4IX_01785 [Acutalibacteraceae bacterium]